MPSKDTPPAKRYKFDNEDTITILVGPSETKFMVHEDVITSRSDFFRASCRGDFKETSERTIRLPEMNIEVCKSYIHWAYTGNVVVKADENVAEDSDSLNREAGLASLYVGADSLGDVRLRDAVIDRIIILKDEKDQNPGLATIDLAYKSTSSGSTLRKLLVGYYLHLYDSDWFCLHGQRLPKEFLFELVLARMVVKNNKTARPSMKNKCDYHEDEAKPSESKKV